MRDRLTAASIRRTPLAHGLPVPVAVARWGMSRFWPAFCALCAIGALAACRGDDSAQGAETGGSAGAAGALTGGDEASTETGGASGDDSGGGATGGDETRSDGGVPDDDGGTTVVPLCVFHTDPPLDNLMDELPDGSADDVVESDASTDDVVDGGETTSDGGAVIDGGVVSDGGAGPRDASSPRDAGASDARAGDGAVSNTTIAVQTNPFIGRYLTDGAGRTLYIYAGDLPGDCNGAPTSNCDSTLATARCADAWPIFEGRPRILGAGLSDDLFGTIMRPDGLYQATYFGWPLYYYKNDTMPLQLNGQNKAKSWWAATVIPPGIVIMKDSSATPQKYIAEGDGRTLYTFAQDSKGTDATNPVSACTGTCLDSYQPFQKNRLSVVTSLEPTDFTFFVRSDGKGQQVAYKGSPLYHATADVRAGQMNGLTAADWAIVLQ